MKADAKPMRPTTFSAPSLVSAAFVLLSIGVGGCEKPSPVGREGLVGNNAGSLVWAQREGTRFAVYLPGLWSSESRSSTNPTTGNWKTDMLLHAQGMPDITITRDRASADRITINSTAYHLADGSVFRLHQDGRVEQLPFAPVDAEDQAYLERLNTYFTK